MVQKITAGDVVWAYISDRSGRNSKDRPVLVIEVTGTNLFCLAISTDPEENQ